MPKKSNIPESNNSFKYEHKLSPDDVKASETVDDEDVAVGEEKENTFHENSNSDLDLDTSNNKVNCYNERHVGP